MAKKSLEKEQDVYGQIFDFIFKQAEKKPEKRKPIKPTGINGKNMLIDSLSATLERPGAFITTQTAKDVNDALDVVLLKIKPDQNGPAYAKVGLSSMVDIFRDPGKFMDKARTTANAIRKGSRINYLSKTMRQLTSNAWARRYADLDTQIAVRLGLASQNLPSREAQKKITQDNWSMKTALSVASTGRDFHEINASDSADMQERAATLLGRQMFTERVWNRMSSEDQERIRKIFASTKTKGTNEDFRNDYKIKEMFADISKSVNGGVPIQTTDYFSTTKAKDELENLFQSRGLKPKQIEYILERYDTAIKGIKDEGGSVSLTDPAFYRRLETMNLDGRIKFLKNEGASLTPEQEAQISSFEKAKLLINAQDLSATNVREARDRLKEWTDDVEKQLRTERDPNKRSALNKQLDELRDGNRQLNNMIFWDSVGSIEGIWSSFKEVTDGNLAGNILNGDFFDSNKNKLFCPSTEKKSYLGVKFNAPKTENKDKTPVTGLAAAYNSVATQMYYFTPRSVIRTLFYNGEGFAYLMDLRKNSVDKYLAEMVLGKEESQFSMDKLWDRIFEGGDSKAAIADILKGAKLDPAHMEELEKYLNSYARLGDFHKVFSFNARLKDAITGVIDKRLAVIRNAIYQKLVNGIFSKYLTKKTLDALGDWVITGGIQSLARAIVVFVADVLGIVTTGGAAEFIINAVAFVVADVLFSIIKVIFQVVVFAIVGVVAIFVIGFGFFSSWQKQTYSYSYEMPGDVYTNPNYTAEGFDPGTGGWVPGDPGTVYNGTVQEIFDKVAAEMGLSDVKLILDEWNPSGAWCHSNISGGQKFVECNPSEVVPEATSNPAYLTNLFRHELTHQLQLENDGSYGEFPYQLYEWGADYMGDNAGGYTFSTTKGVMRATETVPYLLASGVCTKDDLNQLAVAMPSVAKGPCGQYFFTFVTAIATSP